MSNGTPRKLRRSPFSPSEVTGRTAGLGTSAAGGFAPGLAVAGWFFSGASACCDHAISAKKIPPNSSTTVLLFFILHTLSFLFGLRTFVAQFLLTFLHQPLPNIAHSAR